MLWGNRGIVLVPVNGRLEHTRFARNGPWFLSVISFPGRFLCACNLAARYCRRTKNKNVRVYMYTLLWHPLRAFGPFFTYGKLVQKPSRGCNLQNWVRVKCNNWVSVVVLRGEGEREKEVTRKKLPRRRQSICTYVLCYKCAQRKGDVRVEMEWTDGLLSIQKTPSGRRGARTLSVGWRDASRPVHLSPCRSRKFNTDNSIKIMKK